MTKRAARPITVKEAQAESSLNEKMKSLGITKVETEYFMCGDYRYSKLEDAIAQAKRIGNA